MTKAEFIASVEAKPNFIKWLATEVVKETIGTVSKIYRYALVTSPSGFPDISQVWYLEDSTDGSTSFQSVDTLTESENDSGKKQAALVAYLKATFVAYHLVWFDPTNNVAEAEVFSVSGSDLARSRVLVYKIGANPITHKLITN